MVSPVPGDALALVRENLFGPAFAPVRDRLKAVIEYGLPKLLRPDGQPALHNQGSLEQLQIAFQQILILENRLSGFNPRELNLRTVFQPVIQEIKEAGFLV